MMPSITVRRRRPSKSIGKQKEAPFGANALQLTNCQHSVNHHKHKMDISTTQTYPNNMIREANKTSEDKYGYGSDIPDIASKYSYGDDADADAEEKASASKYGYGDNADAEEKASAAKYGYGDDVEENAAPAKASRRSSLKEAGSSRRSSRSERPLRSEPIRRRTSITLNDSDIASKHGSGDDADAEEKASAAKYGYGDDVQEKSAPTRARASRRSSLKQAGSSRRSSIGYTGEATAPGRCEPLRRRSSITFKNDSHITSKYVYGDDANAEEKASAVKYGYGDDVEETAAPTFEKARRRSSLKQAGSSRRSSIGYTGEVTVMLPGRSEPLRRRTSIAFNDYDEVKTVEPVSSLTNEPEKLWYQSEEYDLIKKRIFKLLDLAASAHPDDKICMRGLESHLAEEKQKLKEEQHLAWYAVFLEQYEQRNEGVFDDEIVSKLYELSTVDSKMLAMQRGRQDAADIESYTKKTRLMMRRLSM
jgi:hypothetical protein